MQLSRLEIKGLKINSLSSKTLNIQRSLEKSLVVSGSNLDVIKWLVQGQSRTEENCEQIRIQHEKLDFLVVSNVPCIFLRPKRGLRHIV